MCMNDNWPGVWATIGQVHERQLARRMSDNWLGVLATIDQVHERQLAKCISDNSQVHDDNWPGVWGTMARCMSDKWPAA